ncbi:heavy metal translocatin [Trametopsis cervina]|nr:heavy metal translocatin [Trametopsis cervina]
MVESLYTSKPTGKPAPILRAPRGIYTMSSTSDEVVSTILVSNLHCNSCSLTIKDALASLTPAPVAVEVSIVTQTVTVRHSSRLARDEISSTIEEAGFDVAPSGEDAASPPLKVNTLLHSPSRKHAKHIGQCTQCQAEQNISTPSNHLYQITLSIGGMTCASCSTTITDRVSSIPGVSQVAVNLLGHSATALLDNPERSGELVETIEDAGYEPEVISVQPLHPPSPNLKDRQPRNNFDGPFRLTLSIGGMTCSSCTTTITSILADIPGVSDVAVSLLGHSATALIQRKDIAEQLVEAVEDAGYEADIASVEPIEVVEDQGSRPRQVELRIEGMFCPRCPEKVMALLEHLPAPINILKPVTDYTDPVLNLEYTPAPPHFTIRTILDAINKPRSDPSAINQFSATLHHPPTLEERTRRMHAREQRTLLLRLISAVIVAIPTFIIGVVYMSLVDHLDHTRMWFMRPLWTGNVSRAEWALFFLATPVMFYSAGTFHRRSLKELWALWRPGSRVPIWKRLTQFGSMNLLVSTGVSVAYFSSIALLALAAAQPPSPTGEGDTTTYFDSVVFLAMFLLIGRFLEAYSKGRTADAVTALGKLRPSTALLVVKSDGSKEHSPTIIEPSSTTDLEKASHKSSETELDLTGHSSVVKIPTDLLEVGDIVRVLHGASPPSDGSLVHVSGKLASFDESSLTGESRPVTKDVGDQVFVGTINRGAIVDIRVDAIGGQTMLDHVVKIVREGQTHRAPIERVVDLITGFFVPVVTLLAILTWVIWLSLGLSGTLPPDYLDIPVGGWTVWSLEFAIAVFVVACPCGIGLAAPTALLVGSGLAAKWGILVRGGGEAFQEAAQLDLIVFDKTGTLTEGGDPRVVDTEIIPEGQSGWTTELILGVAAELEAGSSHPLATAIRSYCAEHVAKTQSAKDVHETAGRGLRAEFEELQCQAIIGNEAWMTEHGANLNGQLESRLDAWKSEGNSVVLLALSKNVSPKDDAPELVHGNFVICALFSVSDPLRSEARGVVSALQHRGIRTWMISGDNAVTAKAVARKVGIPETNVIAGVLPHEKAEKIRWLQQVGMKRASKGFRLPGRRLNTRCIVAMVGDGINDAPALSTADVGIAIGSGSDVAISSASFILVSSQLNSILTLIDLSSKVFNRLKFNFLWATIYNLIGLPIAAGVLYPAHGHPRLAPVWASLAMALSSVSVVCSSLLLKTFKEPSIAR